MFCTQPSQVLSVLLYTCGYNMHDSQLADAFWSGDGNMADEWLRVLGEKLGLKGLDMAIDVTRLTDPQQVQALSPNASNHGYPLPTPFSKPTSIKHHLTSSWMYGHTCQSHTHTETQFTIQHSSLFVFWKRNMQYYLSPG